MKHKVDTLTKIETACAHRAEMFHFLRLWMICLLGLFAAWAYTHAQWATPAVFCLMFYVGGVMSGFWFALGFMGKWVEELKMRINLSEVRQILGRPQEYLD